LRSELISSAAKDRETALASLRVELEAEATHARGVAVAEARRLAEGELLRVQQTAAAAAETRADEARREALAKNDAAVADAEQRAAHHKARLDGVVAQLESEKAECARVKSAAATATAAAEARADASAAAAQARADAAELKARTAEMAVKQMQAEVDAVAAANGASEEARTAQVIEAKREIELTRAALAEEKARVEAESRAVASVRTKCAALERQLVEADELRRAMHNQIQELRGNVRVFARARPPLGARAVGPAATDAAPPAVRAVDRDAISVTDRLGDAAVFTFDKVFGFEAKQEEIFEEVSQLVQSALDGYKVCLFSYGQTGSGKTHTMLGAGAGPEAGIIPRAVKKVLEQAETLRAKGYEYVMEASYVEIYNEQIRDLLKPGADHDEKLSIAVNPAGGCPTVLGVMRETVRSVDAAADLVRRAAAARAVESTQMNAQSSRSHTLFLLYITGTHAASGQTLSGCLNLVDLAGSERTDRSGAEGQRMREACAINKSLSTLGDVFKAIGENAKHVPYRNSKLTHLLAPCLGGDGKTLMLVNVAPERESAEESMHSLQFAAKVNAVELGGGKTRAKRNVTVADPNGAAGGGNGGDPNKSRRSSVMPLPPGALARRASMAAGAGGAKTMRPGGTENAPPKSTLDRDRFGVRR
jgi:kinesin family protein C1